jgi:hypothetical protein
MERVDGIFATVGHGVELEIIRFAAQSIGASGQTPDRSAGGDPAPARQIGVHRGPGIE